MVRTFIQKLLSPSSLESPAGNCLFPLCAVPALSITGGHLSFAKAIKQGKISSGYRGEAGRGNE